METHEAARIVARARRMGAQLTAMVAHPGGPLTPSVVVRAVLLDEGWTQRELAVKCELHQPHTNQLATGNRVAIQPSTALRLEHGTEIEAEVWMVLAALAVLDAHT